MAIEGQMVKINGTLARVDIEYRDYARIVWVDNRGWIRRSWHYVNELVPLHIAYGPRSTWPEGGNLDQVEIEREEQAAAAAREIEQRKSRKARRSNKLKRAAA